MTRRFFDACARSVLARRRAVEICRYSACLCALREAMPPCVWRAIMRSTTPPQRYAYAALHA